MVLYPEPGDEVRFRKLYFTKAGISVPFTERGVYTVIGVERNVRGTKRDTVKLQDDNCVVRSVDSFYLEFVVRARDRK